MNIKIPDKMVEEFGGSEKLFESLTSLLKFSPDEFSKNISEKISEVEMKISEVEKRLLTISEQEKLVFSTQDQKIKEIEKEFSEAVCKIKSESAKTVMEAIAGSGLAAPIGGGDAEAHSSTEKQPKFKEILEQQFATGAFKTVEEAMKFCIRKYPNEYEEYRKNPEPLKFTK